MAEHEITGIIKAAKDAKEKTWEGLAAELNCSPMFLCSVALGQNIIDPVRAKKFCDILGLDETVLKHITKHHPTKAQQDWDLLRQDPVLNRLHEINVVYGTAIKELIHEKFGDGIMSAIDFEVDVEKVEDPKGDRVKVILNGKFLPFRKW